MPDVLKFERPASAADRFEALLRPHFAALYAAAYRLSGSPADAEDLVQEVCLRAWDRRQSLAEMEHPRAWLLRTMYNRFVDECRREQRTPTGLAEDSVDTAVLAGPEAERPDREAERMHNAAALQHAMRRIGDDSVALLMMHDVDGFSVKEIGAVTDLPDGTIKSRLHRARVKLGRLLSRDEGRDAAIG